MMTTEHPQKLIATRRRPRNQDPNCEFVDPNEFMRLAVSNLCMVRADDPEADIRGLRDVTTGRLFLTDAAGLFGEHADEEESNA